MSSTTTQTRGGPNTEAGKAASSKNATTHGLFAIGDFILPDEHQLYSSFAALLHQDLAPSGLLEQNLVAEIRRAMWRLRRCGVIEEGFSAREADPMQDESSARLQLSVDRARSLSHRLLHKCTAELRKLQTERLSRNESLPSETDVAVNTPAQAPAPPPPPDPGSFCKTAPTPPQTPRNAPCPCGSGNKHEICCAKDTPAVLQAA